MPVYTTKFIMLNGPAGSGKSTIAPLLCQQLVDGLFKDSPQSVVMDSFAAPMKHFISTAMGQKYSEMKKDTMQGVLSGYSVREFLIELSERHMKPLYGDDIFGRLMLHRVLRLDPIPHVVIIDDSGFVHEAEALDPHWKNIILVRLERPGYTFKGDSRDYLEDPDYVLKNDGCMDLLQSRITELADWLIKNAR